MENPRFYNIGFYSGSLRFGSRQNDFVTMSGCCYFTVVMSIVVVFVTFVIVVFALMIMIATFVLMLFCFMIMTFVSVAGFTIAGTQ